MPEPVPASGDFCCFEPVRTVLSAQKKQGLFQASKDIQIKFFKRIILFALFY